MHFVVTRGACRDEADIGWDHPEIDIILDSDGKDAGDPADQNVEPPEGNAITRVGDLWLLDKHRLLCGSALDEQSFIALMQGEKATMAFIDPPYNVPIAGHVSGLGKTKHREFVMASGEMSDANFRGFLGGGIKLLAEHMVGGAVMAICMDWRSLLPLQLVVTELGLPVLNLAVWAKTNAGMGSLYRSQHELILIAKRDKERHINNVELGKHGRYRTNVWRHAGVNSFGKGRLDLLKGHPTPKPIALVADVIRDVSHRGQIVLDSFIGSGTTLLAAERTKRIGYGMDLDPCYIDVTIRRWEKMTGQQAILASSGNTFYDVATERCSTSPA